MNLNYLYTPIQTTVEPPIDTKKQELPIDKLSWEDFEKLCLAVVQTKFSINDCEIYGIKGQAQEGIDIYARQENGRYSSYQCKRYQNFELNDINKAVEYFKNKDFFIKSDNLYLCTSCEWNKTQVQNRFEEFKTELEKENITLVKWDKIQLCRLLKDNPQIVFDFFGSEWVKQFNGELAFQQISKSKKFDAKQIIKFRAELYEFYSTIFNIQDPGIPIKELSSPYTLQERFIIPDILSNVKEEGFENNNNKSSTIISNQYDYYYDDYGYYANELKQRNFNNHNEVEESSIDIRIKIDDALITNNKNIIIGDPGAGKSSLLRYITLDILSPNPKLENISQKYGKTFPVWLPFAFITKHLSKDDSLSISDILKLWFNSFDKPHLFEISREAINDERLFLIIDGIDEWSSISSAQQAISRIETIRELYDCKVLYSSRPYGFRILKDFFTNLNVLNLAGFSKIQQRHFVERWYNKWTSLQGDTHTDDVSKSLTDNFIKELEQSGDLKKLAEIPLLLSILIIQKMQDSVLPKNKLEALKEITQYLIKKHPVKRISDAGIVLETSNDIDFKDIFCELAIYIQKESNDGVILKSDAYKIIRQYLVSYAGYDEARAKVRSQELIEIGANNYGIIIEKSNDEISFGHKQFQEFLAAQYLYESDDETINDFITQYGANPTFHQVIISLFGLIPIKQVKKYNKHFEILKKAVCEKYQEDYLNLISYEVAINIENTPVNVMNTAFDSITHEFIYETDPIYKEVLLKLILNALQNARLKDKVEIFLAQFFPYQYIYSDSRVNALQDSNQINSLQIEFLKKALINGTIKTRYEASCALKKHIKNEEVVKFIKDTILNCSHPEVLAFAINSIITNDIEEQEREKLVKSVVVDIPIVQFFLFKYKVFVQKHSQDDLKPILLIVNQIHYSLEQESIELLIDGFSQNDNLKEILIKSTYKRFYDEEEKEITIDAKIAWKVLFHSFNKDKDTINLIKTQFENEKYPFSFDRVEIFQKLNYYFKGIEELIPSIEKWMKNTLERYNSISPEIAFVSIFIHTDEAKDILLNDLPRTKFSHWNVMALLEGWGDDASIKEKLKNYFRTVETSKTSASAHFISKVFDDSEKEEAIEILENILFDNKSMFRERAISSLIELDKEYFRNNILNKLMEELELFPKDVFGQYYTALDIIVKNFPLNKIVQSYVLGEIKRDKQLYNMAILYFPDLVTTEIEESVLKESIPLTKELRLLIIESFTNLLTIPQSIESVLSNFEKETEEEVMGDMAICLFNHLKGNNKERIIELCKPLVFARGFDYEIKRNIAFVGYLISKRLDDYFSMEENQDSKEHSKHLHLFDDYSYNRALSGIMISSIIDNFDYLISYADKDFNKIVKHLAFSKDIESIWGFFARYSVKSSPTYNYIMEFVSEHSSTIKDNYLISFLNRANPQSPILKDILLRLIKNNDNNHNMILAGRMLGQNFKRDNLVYKEICEIKDVYDVGKIMALCSGWKEEPILYKLWKNILKEQTYVDNYVGFNLKFLFRDVNNLTEFIKEVFTNIGEFKQYHRFFYIPMLERLKRDKDFSLAIKELLLSCDSINEKISYYNLLSQVNMIDEDIISWKNKIVNFKNDFGYDIVSNKIIRLKDVLYDYNY